MKEMLERMHHAYCILGGREATQAVFDFVENRLNIPTRANPDFHHFTFESMTISDSRMIRDMHASLPMSATPNARKIFIIETDAITNEAQNALLKIFEEPQKGTHFFIIIPSQVTLLPTLLSRVLLVRADDGEGAGAIAQKQAKEFLGMSAGEKVAFVDALAADISDEKKPKRSALEFLDSLEVVLAVDSKAIAKNAQALSSIIRTRSYLRDRSPSIKQLLEYVAVTI